jgi:hypothetical protein
MGQGSSWFMSLGLHLDRAGNDQYICGRSCQGGAEHLSAALLLDGGGNDRYESGQLAQGAGDDRSVGVLWDQGSGIDLYRLSLQGREPAAELGRGQGFARQPHALGMLVDGGGSDRYESVRDGLGHAEPSRHPDRNPTGLIIDLGGDDTYVESNQRAGAIPRDSSIWLAGAGAAGLDTFLASPGWSAAEIEPAEGFAPIGWDRSLLEPAVEPAVEPKEPAVEPKEPAIEAEEPAVEPKEPAIEAEEPTGEPKEPAIEAEEPTGETEEPSVETVSALWTRLESRFDRLVATPSDVLTESELSEVRVLAETSLSVPVRRSAGRLLVAAGEKLGLRVLIAALDETNQDNPGGPRGTGEEGAWLSLVTGTGQGFSPAQWRTWFSSDADDFDLHVRWPAVSLVESAIRAAQRGDPEAMAALCEQAREQLPGDPFIHSRAAALVGRWAWILGHPESHGHRNPELAVRLARLWSNWQPDRAGPFITLAQAWFTNGDYKMAGLALDKAAILDPDNIRLLALRRAMER